MRAELHCHSIYSRGTKVLIEGLNRPKEIVAYAKSLGIKILALTDHDTMEGVSEATREARRVGILLIPGEEVSTKQGHILALGINEPVESNRDILETIDEIHEQGGVAIAAHPFDLRRQGCGANAIYCDAIEVFNALDIERASNWRAKRFALRNSMPITAGSDAHMLAMLGHGVTIFPDCYTVDEVIRAIKKGKTKIEGKYISTSLIVEWATRRLKYSYYYVRNYVLHNYSKPKRALSLRLLKLVQRSPGKIDYLFKAMGYFAAGVVISYAIFRNLLIGSIADLLGR